MKKLILSIACIVMGFTGFSQHLTPQIRIESPDTTFCFTMEQSRNLAKYLVRSVYTDSLLQATSQELDYYYQMALVKDSTIQIQDNRIQNQDELLRVSESIIDGLAIKLQLADKTVRRQKWQKWIFAAGMVLSGVLAISNAHK